MHKIDAEWALETALKVVHHAPDAEDMTVGASGFSGWYLRIPTYDGRVIKVSIEEDVTGEDPVGKEGSGGVPNGRDWQFARTADEKLAAAESIISARDAYEQELRNEIARLTSDKHHHAMCPECRRMARSGGVPNG